MSEHAPLDLRPGQEVDRFVVEAVLGRGGMATVYRVRHAHLDTVHALKVLDVHSGSVQRRLLLEGRTQATLRHRNIVAVTDVVALSHGLGLVMEYVAGPSLQTLLREAPVSLAEAFHLARGILAGVQAAHEAEVIHRDLKPGNILLSIEGGSVLPKITDFGLAKVMSPGGSGDHTRTGMAMGTPAYMAPEQVRDAKDVDHRADVFALGAILYELVTGHKAFDGSDPFEIMQAVTVGTTIPVNVRREGVPPAMVAAIEGALVVDPDARFPDVATLAAAWELAADDSLPEDPWTPARLAQVEALTPIGVEVWEAPSVLPAERRSLTPNTAVPGTTPDATASNTLSPSVFVRDSDDSDDVEAVVPASTPGRGLIVAALVGVSVAFAAGTWFLSTAAPDEAPTPVFAPVRPAPVTPEAVPAAPEPEPEPEPVVEAAPEPEPVKAEPKPVRTPTRTPPKATKPAPAPVEVAPEPAGEVEAEPEVVPEPEPEPEAAPALDASISIRGTTSFVWLRSAAGNFLAGRDRVPPGTYAVVAMFPGGAASGTRVLDVTVGAGDELVLTCDEERLRCSRAP